MKYGKDEVCCNLQVRYFFFINLGKEVEKEKDLDLSSRFRNHEP